MLSIAVLGPVEVRRDGRPQRIPAGRTTGLLVRLALEPRIPVSAERLIEDLWDDVAVDTGRNTLESKVSQLRRALGDGRLVVATAGGYLLDVGADVVDAGRVADLAAAVSRHRIAGDVAAVLDAATRALTLYRGALLPGAGDAAWVVPHRARLDEIRLGLVEARLAALTELQPDGDVVGELETAVAEHPHREGLWVSLITALYRTGRQADALAAGRRVRRLLADELGVDPAPELEALERRILDHDVDPPIAAVRTRTRRGNVPSFGSPTVGREREVAALGDLVATHRLVTVVGTAGVGKTRLAIDVAREAEPTDGPWLVRLDSVPAGGSVAALVADVIGAPSGDTVLDRLAGSAALLVLDNCEHLGPTAADFVSDVLDAAPGTHVLATSQVPLGIDGELVFDLRPLDATSAAELFTSRAVAGRSQDGALVTEVCRALDGLPLAIELAAARTRSLSLGEIARRLDDRFAILTDPSGRRPPRRGALRDAIAWSYELLFPDDQRGLWALACFVDGAPLDAAQRVVETLDVPASTSLDVFDRLVDRSLATTDVDPLGAVRYRLLDSIRTFALERLDDAGGGADARHAQAGWVLDLAERAAREVRGPGQPWCVRTARAERANIDVALAWAAAGDHASLGLRIAVGFGWTWVVIGDGAAGAARVRGALAAVAEPEPDAAAAAGLLAAWLEASAGDLVVAATDLERAAELVPAEDAALQADLDRHRAFLYIQQGRPLDALAAATRSRTVAERLELDWLAAGAANLAAHSCLVLGRLEPAREAAGAALAWRSALGDAWGRMHADAMLGRIADAAGRLDEAEERLGRAAATSAELGFAGQTALHLTNLGTVQLRRGEQRLAVTTLERALDAAMADGDLRMAATARLHIAGGLHALGRDDEAIAALRTNLDWYARAGGGDGHADSAALLAGLTAARR